MTYIYITLAVFLAIFLYVRIAPVSPNAYDKDPRTAGKKGTKGGCFLHPTLGDIPSPKFDMTALQLRQRMERAMTEMGGEKCENQTHDLWVFKTKLWKFPDFLSFVVEEDEHGQSYPIAYSRLHYGRSDFGVNKKRILKILEKL